MKLLLAPDSFKECIPAAAVCQAMATGIREAFPEIELVQLPMADGGEGTLEVVAAARGGELRQLPADDPLGRAVQAEYLWLPGAQLAVIEAARACGLPLLAKDERRPLSASSRGVGQLLLHALANGAQRVIMTVGGTATVDGGSGFARALGYRFLDATGHSLPEGGGALTELASLQAPASRPWRRAEILVATDVQTQLLGQHGAAPVFAPQKGADGEQVARLARGLARLTEVCRRDLGINMDGPGAGAGGGLGGGIVAFAGGRLVSGIDTVMETVGFATHLADADLVITGEGGTEAQTLHGKACAGIARAAAAAGVPCLVLSGAVALNRHQWRELGASAVLSVAPGPQSTAQALAAASEQIATAAAHCVGLFLAGHDRCES